MMKERQCFSARNSKGFQRDKKRQSLVLPKTSSGHHTIYDTRTSIRSAIYKGVSTKSSTNLFHRNYETILEEGKRKPTTTMNCIIGSKRMSTRARTSQGWFAGTPNGKGAVTRRTAESEAREIARIADMKRVALKTEEESRTIKKKIDQYNEFHKQSNDIAREGDIIFSTLNNKFHEFASKINSMLATETAVNELPVNTKETISINAGLNCYFKCPSKLKPKPMKIHIMCEAGVGYGVVYLSSKIIRPKGNNCDKEIPVKKRDRYVFFKGCADNDKVFLDDFIYITIYADRKLTITLEYLYGPSASFPNSHEGGKKEKGVGKVITKVPTRMVVEKHIEGLLKDKHLYSEMMRDVEKIKRKRRERFLRLSGNVDYIDQNRDSMQLVREPSKPYLFDARRRSANAKRECIEEEELKRKFLLAHRMEINKQHQDILKKKLFEKEQGKRKMESWIAYLQLHSFAKIISKKFAEKRNAFIEMQNRFFSGLRIRVYMASKLKQTGAILSTRMCLRLECVLKGGSQNFGLVAYNRSSLAAFSFLKTAFHVKKMCKSMFNFISKVKAIQAQWRCLAELDRTRQKRLAKKWQELVAELVKKNSGKSKRQQAFARKLKTINDDVRNRAIKKYYLDLKRSYIGEVHKFFQYTYGFTLQKKKTVSIARVLAARPSMDISGMYPSLNEEQKNLVTPGQSSFGKPDVAIPSAKRPYIPPRTINKRKAGGKPETKKVEESPLKKPIFKFMPTAELFNTLILKAAEGKI